MNATEQPGLFVVFEGGDSAGKTTQVRELASALAAAGIDYVVTRQPGGTGAGTIIRSLLLDPGSELAPRTEALLYAADKAQHCQEVVLPALRAGKVVVCDRYVDSMLAYQGAGRQLDAAELEQIARWATDDLRPDITVLLDVDPASAVDTIRAKDRMEQAGSDFHARVRDGFLRLAAADPDRYLVLNARDSIATIAATVLARVVAAREQKVSEPSGTVATVQESGSLEPELLEPESLDG